MFVLAETHIRTHTHICPHVLELMHEYLLSRTNDKNFTYPTNIIHTVNHARSIYSRRHAVTYPFTNTHARTHARTHTLPCTDASMHARTNDQAYMRETNKSYDLDYFN